LDGHDRKVDAVTFSPDGKTLATASSGVVRLWDLTSSQVIATIRGAGNPTFSGDGKMIATS
jgi:WD40 repeat protein